MRWLGGVGGKLSRFDVIQGVFEMPLFKPSPKSPQELVKNLRDALQVLTTSDSGKKLDKASLELCCAVQSQLHFSASQKCDANPLFFKAGY